MQLRVATCRPLPEPDPDEDLLLAALARHGVAARVAAWNDPAEDWDAPAATVIRSTWDYVHDLPRYLAWVARAARAAPLWNPARVVRGNVHKEYLLELPARGVATVPTELVRHGERPLLWDLVRERGWSDVVVKPAVGAGSFATLRVRPGALEAGERHLAELVAERDVLVQPYLASVEGHGERALVWIDGAFTHAVRKTPRFAGDEERVSDALPIEPDELALGERALAPLAADLLYARVDVARDAAGAPLVMELELVEPSLFLRQHPPALERLCAALARRLRAAPAGSADGKR
jgi:glutathione synthase/RimK-type ligase-like ATP-grasp enzyme